MARNPGSLALDVALAPIKIGTRMAEWVVGRLTGSASEAEPGDPDPQLDTRPKPLDDVTLARKVETVIFRDRSIAKGKVNVNVAEGIVWLRGEVKRPDLVDKVEFKVRKIPEVEGVENLLHLPKTPAPSRTDTPASQRKTRRSPRRPENRKVTPRRERS
jgi:osmotically-inducible protein OsmY